MFVKDNKSIVQYVAVAMLCFVILSQLGRILYARAASNRERMYYVKQRQMYEYLETNKKSVDFLKHCEIIDDYETFLSYTLTSAPGVHVVNGIDKSYGQFIIQEKRLQITCKNAQQLNHILQYLHQIKSTITIIDKMNFERHDGMMKVYLDVRFIYCKTTDI